MANKPKICIIRQYYFPKEVHLRRDVKALIEHGFAVDVICARDDGEKSYDNWNGVNIYRIPIHHLRKGILRYLYEYCYFFIRATVLLTILFFHKKYECVEVDTMPDFLVFSAVIPKLFKSRVVLYLFENMPLLFADKYRIQPNHLLIRILKVIEILCVKFADRVIITHKRSEKFFNKSVVVFNVPDEELFIPISLKKSNSDFQTDIYNSKENVKVITHSTLTEIYGIQNILRAMALLKDKYPKVRCEILGDGEYKGELIKLTKSLTLDNSVKFKGAIPFEKIAENLRSADIGIVSTIGEYLLPNKLFEYIALGIPVVCASTCAITAFFDDDELIFYKKNDYQDLANRIEWTMFHYDIALKKARSAQSKYQQLFQWAKTRNLYINCYLELLKK